MRTIKTLSGWSMSRPRYDPDTFPQIQVKNTGRTNQLFVEVVGFTQKKRAVSSYSYDSGLNGSPLRSAFDFCRTYGGVDTNTTVITKTNRAEQGLY